MNEKLVLPLELMPPQLRHYVETVLTKYQHLGQNPLSASSTKLEKQYEVLTNLWQALQWAQPLRDLQQLEETLQQQQSEHMTTLPQHLHEQRQTYSRNLDQRKQRLHQRRQNWQRTKKAWRNSLIAIRQEVADNSKLLTATSEQLIELQLQDYNAEWTNAEQRIELQNTLLQQAEANYPTALQQHRMRLVNAFEKLKQNLSEQQQQQAPLKLTQLQQKNTQRRADLPALVATWKAAAAEREIHYKARLTDLQQVSLHSDDSALTPDILTSKQLHLSERKESLIRKRQQLEARKWSLPPKPLPMPRLPMSLLNKPEALPYAQLTSELPRLLKRNTERLKVGLRELIRCAVSSSELKRQLLTAGLLDEQQFPEIDVTWVALE